MKGFVLPHPGRLSCCCASPFENPLLENAGPLCTGAEAAKRQKTASLFFTSQPSPRPAGKRRSSSSILLVFFAIPLQAAHPCKTQDGTHCALYVCQCPELPGKFFPEKAKALKVRRRSLHATRLYGALVCDGRQSRSSPPLGALPADSAGAGVWTAQARRVRHFGGRASGEARGGLRLSCVRKNVSRRGVPRASTGGTRGERGLTHKDTDTSGSAAGPCALRLCSTTRLSERDAAGESDCSWRACAPSVFLELTCFST